ncbi:DUF2975 domain-containing protein [Paucibacter sp. DJ2R-2]|uniref:DUF2975 domain-containing protein n=1 Tax=Paucibacter sp. DJ2R-2 TaxID=2893558 RepID=UPI0021E41E37|nr:DUF2975 domain-containing protein [Paucibacter sp. DJ2R-2]MCV2422330.1 DUF2975 domain-containing protein [Paucibacter sp. DJ4R-1]MCV2440518.1 DUF2975 domain-containing protein [Paucibacter sp. DJ2R-2]
MRSHSDSPDTRPPSAATGHPSAALDRVRRLARWVQLLCIAGAAIVLIVPAQLWSRAEWLEKVTRNYWVTDADIPLQLDAASRAWGWAASCLPSAVLLFALWQVWCLFGAYRRGQVFTREPVLRLRRLALSLMVHALAQPLGHTLSILALTFYNPVGQRQLVLGLGFDHFLSFFVGLVIWGIAQVMQEAQAVAAENAEFI